WSDPSWSWFRDHGDGTEGRGHFFDRPQSQGASRNGGFGGGGGGFRRPRRGHRFALRGGRGAGATVDPEAPRREGVARQSHQRRSLLEQLTELRLIPLAVQIRQATQRLEELRGVSGAPCLRGEAAGGQGECPVRAETTGDRAAADLSGRPLLRGLTQQPHRVPNTTHHQRTPMRELIPNPQQPNTHRRNKTITNP